MDVVQLDVVQVSKDPTMSGMQQFQNIDQRRWNWMCSVEFQQDDLKLSFNKMELDVFRFGFKLIMSGMQQF